MYSDTQRMNNGHLTLQNYRPGEGLVLDQGPDIELPYHLNK